MTETNLQLKEATVSSTFREWQQAIHAASKASGKWARNPGEDPLLEDLAIVALLHSDYAQASEYAVSGGDFELDLHQDPLIRVAALRNTVRSLHPGHIRMLAKVALIHEALSKSTRGILQNDIQYREGDAGKPEGFLAWMAETVSRIFDLCGHHALDLGMVLLKVHQHSKA